LFVRKTGSLSGRGVRRGWTQVLTCFGAGVAIGF
jgi:hypothetical protein